MRTPFPVDPASFPVLRAVLRGYLHEDFVEEHGSAIGALAAFRNDAAPAEREALAAEGARLRTAVGTLSLARLRRLLADGFGCAWSPATRGEADAFLRALAEGPGSVR